MVITDHIILTGDNSLKKPNDEAFGTRYPDTSQHYDIKLIE